MASHTATNHRSFQNEVAEIQAQIERLSDSSVTSTSRKEIANQCLASISTLANTVADASSELPSYDQRAYNDHVRLLQEKLNHAQNTLAPKAKFSFKSKRTHPTSALDPPSYFAQRQLTEHGAATPSSIGSHNTSRSGTPVHLQIDDHLTSINAPVPVQPGPLLQSTQQDLVGAATMRQPLNSDPSLRVKPDLINSGLSLSSQTGVYVSPQPSAPASHGPLLLSQFDRCFVDILTKSASSTSFASLTLTDSSSSLLVCGSVGGPAHITNVKNSIIVLDCRQFRMHDCKNVDVYLYCTSRPIIEDCQSIRFMAMPTYLLQLLDNYKPSATRSSNMYNQVDDFKWLKAEQSPNWQLLSPHDSVTEWTWRSILPAKLDVDVEQVLRDVKISI